MYLGFAALLVPLFVVPGWLWLRRAGVEPVIALYAGFGVSALAGAAIVALGLLLPWGERETCIGGLILIVAVTIWCGFTSPRPLAPPRAELGGMLAFVLVFISLAAFSGPPTRAYGVWSADTVGPGRIDTPRWPGLPADNTLPFRTGQVAFFKQGGAHIRNGYSPGWWISDRTPLTGLDFAFAAGALGVHVSSANIEALPTSAVAMTLKDHYGFWAYQLVAMLLNIAIVLGVYLLARVWLGRRVALVSAFVSALLPGLFLNALYTWPKQAIGYFVLVGAACALKRRPVLAGAFAALGYLVHPAGVVWVVPLALVALSDPELRARTGRTLVRFLAPVVVLVAPWEFFTSQIMHAVSRWTLSPLGYLMTDPRESDFGKQLSIGWHQFVSNGIVYDLWQRVQSTAGSLFPIDLYDPLSKTGGGYRPSAQVAWSAAHGFSVWGMVGMVLFPFAVIVVARDWPRLRSLTLRLAMPAVVIAEIANGLAYPFANQSMFPLVGLFAIVAGYGLLNVGRRARAVLVAITCAELLTLAYGDLYRPYNISTGAAVLFTVIAAGAQLALIAALAWQLDLLPRRWSGLRARVGPGERLVAGTPGASSVGSA